MRCLVLRTQREKWISLRDGCAFGGALGENQGPSGLLGSAVDNKSPVIITYLRALHA